MSHPTWVRGLKLLIYRTVININRSHPTWVRGLKYVLPHLRVWPPYVAPHVGAWIEICQSSSRGKISSVAPHVGAWIEIFVAESISVTKLVAPHVGAWIEIFQVCAKLLYYCPLKLFDSTKN